MFTSEEQIERNVSEMLHGLADAAGDFGYDFHPSFGNPKALIYWNELKKSGVKKDHLKDAMADWFYNDVDTMADLAGDRLHDLACTFTKKMNKKRDELFIILAKEAKKQTYVNAIKKAMDILIERHQRN